MKTHAHTSTALIGIGLISLVITGACQSQRHASTDIRLESSRSSNDSTVSHAVTAISELLVAHTGTIIDSPVITIATPSGHKVSIKANRLSSDTRLTRDIDLTDSTSTIKTAGNRQDIAVGIHEERDTETAPVSPGRWWWLLIAIPLTGWLLYSRHR